VGADGGVVVTKGPPPLEQSYRCFVLATKNMSDYDRDMLAFDINACYGDKPTVESIRAVMEHVGLWDEFVDWHDGNFASILDANWDNFIFARSLFDLDRYVSVDILTDPALLIQACISFMEGRK
jgi:hypothetical protein